MWRMTMISTMPVVITAMEEVWTSRIHRLRGVRKVPPSRPSPPRMKALARSKPTQMTSSAPSMPARTSPVPPEASATFPLALTSNVANASGTAFIATTGYGYGDDFTVGLHERLLSLVGHQLDGTVSLGTALIAPLYVIAGTVFYDDVRVRKEAYDLELLAEELQPAATTNSINSTKPS